MATTKLIQVLQVVEVTVDETKFTQEFMEEFQESFYHFVTLEEHMQHLAQLHARGQANWPDSFIEGYGKASDMGIKFDITDSEIITL